jgi:2Fe-2S ferredoxin
MTRITFIDQAGTERTIEAREGSTLKDAALEHDIPGIDADCGGVCACATCHVFIDEAFWPVVGPPGECEAPMLEFLDEVRPTSRLSCQIEVTPALDGLRVGTPISQQ